MPGGIVPNELRLRKRPCWELVPNYLAVDLQGCAIVVVEHFLPLFEHVRPASTRARRSAAALLEIAE